jgi:peptide/nickel transport system permease protein
MLNQYLVKRLVYIIFTLFIVSLAIFGVTQVLPGNAATMILGTQATEEKVAAIEAQLGLNQPLHVQYIDWLVGFVTLNWGESYILNEPVLTIVLDRGIKSLQLATLTMGLLVLIGIPFGVLSAVYQDRPLDYLLSIGSYIGISLPEFVTGTLLLLLFAGPVFQVLPTGGYAPIEDGVITWLRHLILPVVTLNLILIAHIMRLTRSEVIDEIHENYVRTARLKGVSESQVIFNHALRNALLPTITILALDFGYLLGSIVVVEEIFAYPGLGRLIIQSIQNRDVPTLQIVMLLLATTFSFANLAADLLYARLDPRISYGSSGGE